MTVRNCVHLQVGKIPEDWFLQFQDALCRPDVLHKTRQVRSMLSGASVRRKKTRANLHGGGQGSGGGTAAQHLIIGMGNYD
jgi:hypothetical protein